MRRRLRIAIVSLYALENNGIRHITASLRAAGFPVTEIYFKDWANNRFPWPQEHEIRRLVELLADRRIDVVGFSVRASAFHRIATHLTRRIRADLGIPVLWGGMHPTFLPRRAASQADYVGLGELDLQVVEFFDRLERGASLEGCLGFWFRRDGELVENDLPPLVNDLDEVPFRDYTTHRDKFHIDGTRVVRGDPFLHNPEFTVLASRGCPYWTCTYCSNTVTRPLYHGLGHAYRIRSVENLVRELEAIRAATDRVRFVRFDDEVFPTRADWVEEFRHKWPRRVGLPFELLVDPRMVTEPSLRQLRDAGLRSLCMGIQASERVNREVYHRPVSNRRIIECQRIFHALGFKPNLQVIWDDPFSTEQDKDDLFRLLMALDRPFEVFLFGLTLYPGTHLARRLLREGRVTPEHVEGEGTHAFEQFRVDLNYPRSPRDRRWLALIVLLNKPFIPRSLIWKLYRVKRFERDPEPLVQFAQAANLVNMSWAAGRLALRGELSGLMIKRWLNPQSLVTM